ncbi:C40 family peptidase [Shewanella glacialipiscicola]|uniref:C40 family peptidase n=1 Tax=Shewanella glacialipiscicola TaxID=614069 RepID=UPI003D7A4883
MHSSLLHAFTQHAAHCYPNECCGLIIKFGAKSKYMPCDNKATNKADEFVIDSQQYAAIEDQGQIIGICHSHPDASSKPSQRDVAMCEASGVPWHIISWPDGDLRTVVPAGEHPALIGRPFVHGVWDCYSCVRDWYREILQITLLDFDRQDGWWEGEQELYLDNFGKAGFAKTHDQSLQIGDVILMQIQSQRVNHAAVYVGEGKIIHHLYGRLSRHDIYGGYWQRNTRLVVRYNNSNSAHV